MYSYDVFQIALAVVAIIAFSGLLRKNVFIRAFSILILIAVAVLFGFIRGSHFSEGTLALPEIGKSYVVIEKINPEIVKMENETGNVRFYQFDCKEVDCNKIPKRGELYEYKKKSMTLLLKPDGD